MLQVGVLGPLTVVVHGRAIEVAGGRLRALLARLAVEPGRRVSTLELAAAVWPDEPPADPANALQSLVSRLRRTLGDATLVAGEATGYRLALRPGDLDASVFADRVSRAREALRTRDDDAAYADLAAGLTLWRGEPLSDVGDGDFRLGFVSRWQEERLAAEKLLFGIRLRRGEGAELCSALEELVAAHPFDESLTVLLLEALVAANRVPDALSRYERQRRFLADQLGTDPGRDLQELHVRMLRGDPPRPPMDPPTRARSNLRTWLTRFVGRDTDVTRVLDSVRTHRLTTIVGPGGAGKTRLASEAASRWLTDGTDDAWLVELAPVTEPANLPAAILGALGLRDARVVDRSERPAPDAMDRLLDALHGSQCLLVIDNCEHLIEPVAAILDAILGQAPGVRVLTTSREPLALTGEAICPLPTLAQPPPASTPTDAEGFAAVQLWMDRARVARPDFALTADTIGPVIEIVRRLDGLPLAIELAAARLRVLPVAAIAGRLSDRFRLLTGGNRAGLPRHRTLRAVVEWSWDLLSDSERLLAERLAVFPAGADSRAATAICADERLAAVEIDALLIALVDKSLLQSIEDPGSGVRFRMLETIREYGAERLAERDELETARLAHSGYYADLAVELEPVVRGRHQLVALQTLEVERENILAALRFLGDSGRPVQALRVGLALAWYWSLVGSTGESVTWLSFVVAINEADPPPELVFARAGLALSVINTFREEDTPPGQWQQAVAETQRLLVELLDAPPAPFPGLEVLRPMIAHYAGRPDLAEEMLERGLVSPDAWVRAGLLATHAFSAENDGDVVGMRATAQAAYEQFSQIGDRWGLSSCLLVLARVATLDDRVDEAVTAYELAWTLLAELGGSSDDEVFIRIRMADLYSRQGRWREAIEQIEGSAGGLARAMPADFELFAGASRALIDWVSGRPDEALTRARQLRGRLTQRAPTTGPVQHQAAVVLSTAGGLEAVVGDLAQAAVDLSGAYAAGLASADMPILSIVGLSVAAYALARQEYEAGAVILGAAAQIRGADDPGDPLVVMLTAALRAGQPDFDGAYARGLSLDRAAAVAALDPVRLA